MMENITKIWEEIWNSKIFSSILIIVVSLLLYRIISYILGRSEKKEGPGILSGKKGKTYIKLARSLMRYVFLIITILTLLQINGIDVSSVLAGVGILGVIFGLAIQDWLKDIIRGSSILSDSYFAVGDIVKYKDIEGKVLVIGLKTTKIQDIKTSNIISIANRNIEEIQVVSNLIYVAAPMPYEVSLEKAEKAIGDILKIIEKNEYVTGCRYLGVSELADSCIKYNIEVTCDQQHKLQARRDALRAILVGMADNNIEVPYTQIDIHNKE